MNQPLRKEEIFYTQREQAAPRKKARARKSFSISRSRLPAIVLSLLLVYLLISFSSQFSKLSVMQSRRAKHSAAGAGYAAKQHRPA